MAVKFAEPSSKHVIFLNTVHYSVFSWNATCLCQDPAVSYFRNGLCCTSPNVEGVSAYCPSRLRVSGLSEEVLAACLVLRKPAAAAVFRIYCCVS